MSRLRHRAKQGFLGKSGKALVLLCLFASVLALANSATLHQTLHPNATAPDHQCAVTLLANGQVDVCSGIITALPPTCVLISFVLPACSFETGDSFNLPLSRGPPALLS